MRRASTSQELVDLAVVAAAAGNDGLAIERFERAVTEDPSSYNYVRLGAAYRRSRDLHKAADAYSQAMMKAAIEGRDNPAIRTGLAFVYIDLEYPSAMVVHCLEAARRFVVDSVGLKIIASGYKALSRRDRHPGYAELAAELLAQADAVYSPSAEMDRNALRIEQMLRGHVAEVREVLADHEATASVEPAAPFGSATQSAHVRFLASGT